MKQIKTYHKPKITKLKLKEEKKRKVDDNEENLKKKPKITNTSLENKEETLNNSKEEPIKNNNQKFREMFEVWIENGDFKDGKSIQEIIKMGNGFKFIEEKVVKGRVQSFVIKHTNYKTLSKKNLKERKKYVISSLKGKKNKEKIENNIENNEQENETEEIQIETPNLITTFKEESNETTEDFEPNSESEIITSIHQEDTKDINPFLDKSDFEILIQPKWRNQELSKQTFVNWHSDYKADSDHTLDHCCFICKKKFPTPQIMCCKCHKSFHSNCILNFDEKYDFYCPSHICSVCQEFCETPKWNCYKCFKSLCLKCSKTNENFCWCEPQN